MTSECSGMNKRGSDFPGTLKVSEKHYSDVKDLPVGAVTMPLSLDSDTMCAVTLRGQTSPTRVDTDKDTSTVEKTIQDSKPCDSSELNPLEILHRQWGYMGANRIKETLKNGLVKGCKYTYKDVHNLRMRDCEHCLQGRMRAKPERGTTDHN